MRRFFLATTAAVVVALGSVSVQAQEASQTRTVQQSSQQCVTPVRLGVSAFPTGNAMEVSTVQPGTAAARLGLEAGDRILEINGRQVRSVIDLQAA